MSVKLEYLSKQLNRSENTRSVIETYYGNEAEIDIFVNSLSIGGFYSDKGYLSGIRKLQKGGDIWSAEIEYTIEYDDAGQSENSGTGAQQTTLDGAILSLPIEGHKNYKTNWNYYLIRIRRFGFCNSKFLEYRY